MLIILCLKLYILRFQAVSFSTKLIAAEADISKFFS